MRLAIYGYAKSMPSSLYGVLDGLLGCRCRTGVREPADNFACLLAFCLFV